MIWATIGWPIIGSGKRSHWREKFAGERYIAIQDLAYGAVWYLPDVYGEVLEISVREPVGVSLRYAPDGGGDVRQVCVPIYFYERDAEGVLDFDQFVHGEKSVFGAQEGLEASPADGAWRIWEETFSVGEAEYTVLFERISPVYNPGYEFGEMQADYCLSVRDGEGYTLSWQMIVHYPVVYEEVHWLMDFSGDGFSDVAFCTDFYDIPEQGVYPRSDGYCELIYSNGEVAQENRIEKDFYEEDAFWFAEECVWSANYKGSVRMYPEWPEWEEVETATGGIVINKYVRAASGAE